MKRFIPALVACAVPVLTYSQGLAVTYDFKTGAVTPATMVASQRLVTSVFDIKWLNLDAMFFTGVSFDEGQKPLGAAVGAIGIQPRISEHWYAQLGLTGSWLSGKPVATGVVVGVSYRF